MTQADAGKVIERIYDSVIAPHMWGQTLDHVAHYLGAAGAIIFDEQTIGGVPKVTAAYCSTRYDIDALNTYLDNFCALEVEDQNNFRRAALRHGGLQLVSDTEFLAPDAMATRANVVAMEQAQLRHRAGTLLNQDTWNTDRFSVQYHRDHGPITPDELGRAGLILGHLAKAMSMGRSLMLAQQVKSGLEDIANTLAFGMAIVTSGQDVVFENAEFERLRGTHPSMGCDGGKLRFTDRDAATKIQALCQGQDMHRRAGANPRQQVVVLGDEYESSGVVAVEISPLHHNADIGPMAQPLFVMLALDINQNYQIKADRMGAYFDLSQAEQHVLSLAMQGHSNREIADIRNTSAETVKSQMVALLRKTFSRNRTDLTRLSATLGLVNRGMA